MARPNRELIRVLRVTAWHPSGDTNYQWGQMGSCNCRHLHRAAMG